MIGMSSTIKRTGVYADVTSTCIRSNMRNERTFDQTGWDQAEAVNVTFHGDTSDRDSEKVLVYSNGGYSPLVQLSYIKFIGMFYGLEQVADDVYRSVAANYRCAAARVQDLTMNNNYPSGAWISAYQSNGDDLTVFQNDWWNTIASDAGSKLVNVSSEAEEVANTRAQPGLFSLPANQQSILSKESWALIDTSYYNQIDNPNLDLSPPDVERINAESYAEVSGMGIDAYAINEKKVYLTDKAHNRNQRHSKKSVHLLCIRSLLTHGP